MNKQRMTWAVIGAFIASFVLAKMGMRDAAHETFGAAVTIMWLRLCISSNAGALSGRSEEGSNAI